MGLRSLQSNLSIRARLVIILLTLMIPIGVFGERLHKSFSVSLATADLEIKGAQYVSPLLNLLNDVADYQMSSRSRLAGRTPEKSPEELAAVTDKRLSEIAALDKDLAEDVGMTSESLSKSGSAAPTVDELSKKWSALKSGEYSAAKYNEFLSNVNDIIAHVADVSGLRLIRTATATTSWTLQSIACRACPLFLRI